MMFVRKKLPQQDKVKVNGTFSNFNVTVLNVSATDNGFYWCEFNLEDKKNSWHSHMVMDR